MIEDISTLGEQGMLVPLRVDGHLVYLSSSAIGRRTTSDEVEVASRPATLDEALAGVAAFAERVAGTLREADVTRLSVEFNCEFAVESGKFVAILGKASAKSGVKVGLEWEKPTS
ncbi:CU044_2847 family protein [Micromonospora chersina]|uniref:CU044_2847 family protein n=1 Tax=Micromonospora chersina TaxID=47854 RepID=UPI0033D215B2